MQAENQRLKLQTASLAKGGTAEITQTTGLKSAVGRLLSGVFPLSGIARTLILAAAVMGLAGCATTCQPRAQAPPPVYVPVPKPTLPVPKVERPRHINPPVFQPPKPAPVVPPVP